jgi:hypothetical protein
MSSLLCWQAGVTAFGGFLDGLFWILFGFKR